MRLLFFIVCHLFLVDSLVASKKEAVKYASKSQRVQITQRSHLSHSDHRVPRPDRRTLHNRVVAKQDPPTESTDTTLSTESTESTESTDTTDTTDSTLSTDTTESTDTTLSTDTTDTTSSDTFLTDPPTTAPLPPVSCTTNANCPSDRPFCQQNSNMCQACLSDFDCRNSVRCNAQCTTDNYNRNRCVTPVGVSRLVCQRNEVCYKSDGVCQRSCIPSGNSANGAAVPCNSPNRTLQVGKYCNNQDGVCYSCLVNADCGISKNATCNSQCKYISASYQYTCSEVTPCAEDQTCSPKLSLFLTTDLYTCKTSSGSYFLIPSIATLFVLLIAAITV